MWISQAKIRYVVTVKFGTKPDPSAAGDVVDLTD